MTKRRSSTLAAYNLLLYRRFGENARDKHSITWRKIARRSAYFKVLYSLVEGCMALINRLIGTVLIESLLRYSSSVRTCSGENLSIIPCGPYTRLSKESTIFSSSSSSFLLHSLLFLL